MGHKSRKRTGSSQTDSSAGKFELAKDQLTLMLQQGLKCGLQESTYKAAWLAREPFWAACTQGLFGNIVEPLGPAEAFWLMLSLLDIKLDGDDKIDPIFKEPIEAKIKYAEQVPSMQKYLAVLWDASHEHIGKAKPRPLEIPTREVQHSIERTQEILESTSGVMSERDQYVLMYNLLMHDSVDGARLAKAFARSVESKYNSDQQAFAQRLDRHRAKSRSELRRVAWSSYYCLLLDKGFLPVDVALAVWEGDRAFKYLPRPCWRFVDRKFCRTGRDLEEDAELQRITKRLTDMESKRSERFKEPISPQASLSALRILADSMPFMLVAARKLDEHIEPRYLKDLRGQVTLDVRSAIKRQRCLRTFLFGLVQVIWYLYSQRQALLLGKRMERAFGKLRPEDVQNKEIAYPILAAIYEDLPDLDGKPPPWPNFPPELWTLREKAHVLSQKIRDLEMAAKRESPAHIERMATIERIIALTERIEALNMDAPHKDDVVEEVAALEKRIALENATGLERAAAIEREMPFNPLDTARVLLAEHEDAIVELIIEFIQTTGCNGRFLSLLFHDSESIPLASFSKVR